MGIEPSPSAWIFPDPRRARDDMVAIGADLCPGTILSAYRHGLFPMPLPRSDDVGWWSPVRRGLLPIGGLHVTRSMRQSAKRFDITIDRAFADVVAACGDPARDGGWIDAKIQQAYRRLYDLGWAHSVEVWLDGDLAGGLYGVAIGGLFAGESMFHKCRDASKVALMSLVALLDDGLPARILDVQWASAHLTSLGAIEVPRDRYLSMLPAALALPAPAQFKDRVS